MDSGEKPESIRTCEAKSLYYAGFKSLVKSLENTCVAEVHEGVSPDRGGGEVLQSGSGELWVSWVRIWRRQHPGPGCGGSVVGSGGGTSGVCRLRVGEAKTGGWG